MSRFELRVRPERLSAWRAAAAEAGLSVSAWVRLLVEAELEQRQKVRDKVAVERARREQLRAEMRGDGLRVRGVR